jgi:REP element-mobilizing transposase RayT
MGNKNPRAYWWDYRFSSTYFITICTYQRRHYFGKIENGVMMKNELGSLVNEEWLKTTEKRKDMDIQLDNFFVMPNHFHAIITIGINEFNTNEKIINEAIRTKNNAKSLGSIIRGFKGSVTKQAKIIANFRWQKGYHDHIIRSKESFFRIANYIENNPKNWEDDRFWKNELK